MLRIYNLPNKLCKSKLWELRVLIFRDGLFSLRFALHCQNMVYSITSFTCTYICTRTKSPQRLVTFSPSVPLPPPPPAVYPTAAAGAPGRFPRRGVEWLVWERQRWPPRCCCCWCRWSGAGTLSRSPPLSSKPLLDMYVRNVQLKLDFKVTLSTFTPMALVTVASLSKFLSTAL